MTTIPSSTISDSQGDYSMLNVDPPPRDAPPGVDEDAAPSTHLTEAEQAAKFPNRPRNHSSTLPFHELLLSLFNPLTENRDRKHHGGPGSGKFRKSGLRPHEIRRQIIERFIEKWRREVGNDIFPAFRLIMCDKDRDRSMYGLKEKKIGGLLVKVMGIGKDTMDGKALSNWKQPGNWRQSAGDFSRRCYDILKTRPMISTYGKLRIDEVNEMLDQLSHATTEAEQLPIFRRFYQEMCPEELWWLIRILLRQMRVGATEKTFFDAWHPDADDLFNVSSSLRRVCWDLYDPNFRLNDDKKGVTLMSCFQPQLAQFQKHNFENVIRLMGAPERPFWIEEKLDGERMQMHYKDGKFRWWSRKAKEYTHLYGEDFDSGSVARFMKDTFHVGVDSIVLDGEMITWDPIRDKIVGFGTLKTAAMDTLNDPWNPNQNRPLFRVFDLLHLNGTCFINYPATIRREALKKSINPTPRRVEIHEYAEATTAAEIETALRKVVEEASEGLVIKKPLSLYRLNDRNDDWIKVKPEYMNEFGENLDCLVVGGYYGTGRRGKGTLSSFLCALRVDGTPERDPKFYSFFKVGGGFTADDYKTMTGIFDGHSHDWEKGKPGPLWLELAGGTRQFEKPDQWIDYQHSVILEVKAAQVTATDQFRTSFTLRFPRFKKIRQDKGWKEALTISGFLKLKEEAAEKQAEKGMEMETRRRGAKKVKKELKIAGDDAIPTFASVPVKEGTLFKAMTFCVLTETKSRLTLESTIKSHGGTLTQSATTLSPYSTNPNHLIVASSNLVKVQSVIRTNKYDILHPRYIQDCVTHRTILPLEPKYVYHFAPQSTIKQKVESNVDDLGDAYARDISVEELTQLMKEIDGSGDAEGLLEEEEMEELAVGLPGWCFKGCKIVVWGEAGTVGRRVMECLVRFGGGECMEILEREKGVTHVVVENEGEAREVRGVLMEWVGAGQELPRVVGGAWVEEGIKEGTKLEEERFTV